MRRHPDLLTTGEAAARLRVSKAELCRLIARGHLKGRRIPGSLHRRLERAEVERAAAAWGVPAFDPANPNGVNRAEGVSE